MPFTLSSFRVLAVAGLVATLWPSLAHAETICTVVMDADSGKFLVQNGRCDERHTPASTFKIPLAAMGYDAGFLKDAHQPVFAFQDGDPAWGGEAWKQPTDPERWLKYSVVWYSQRITRALGEQKLHAYATGFGYGNADFSGDPGKDNGLERAWIISSLKISPLEQVAFLKRLVKRQLPISARATDMTLAVVEKTTLPGRLVVSGKTGMAYPRQADGSLDESRPWGWFVGWTTHGDRTYVFARLMQDEKKTRGSTGVRCREALLAELPGILARQR